jgi:hypothetical protein
VRGGVLGPGLCAPRVLAGPQSLHGACHDTPRVSLSDTPSMRGSCNWMMIRALYDLCRGLAKGNTVVQAREQLAGLDNTHLQRARASWRLPARGQGLFRGSYMPKAQVLQMPSCGVCTGLGLAPSLSRSRREARPIPPRESVPLSRAPFLSGWFPRPGNQPSAFMLSETKTTGLLSGPPRPMPSHTHIKPRVKTRVGP